MTVTDQQFQGHAAYGAGQALKPYSYTPCPLGAEDVEIEISHCGICGSDIHTIDSAGGWGGSNFPVIVGHEIVGKVVAAGPNVKDMKIGDRVGVGAQQYSCLEKGCQECDDGHEQCCTKIWWTYNSKRPNGTTTQGGYANKIRVRHQFAFKIPDEIDSVSAAPLLCAGLTVYAPLKRENFKAGAKVGVVGIGGLGHLAVQYAAALGATVTAISHSPNKKAEAIALGATHFLTSSDFANHPRSLDTIIVCANAKGQDWSKYLSLLKVHGRLILVALPEEDLAFVPHSLTGTQVGVVGSVIGSIAEMKDMLEFSAKHNIRPVTQIMKLADCNEALDKVRKGDVKYRIVLDCASASQ